MQEKGSPFPLKAESITVLLGAYNISDNSEPCRKEVEVFGIFVHTGWNSDNHQEYNHDIALLKLETRITEFNPMIIPICLKNSNELSDIQTGTLAGYGEFNGTRNLSSQIPLKAKVTIISTEWLASKHKMLAQFFWLESFAAGSETAGVCPGDSGSGFYVHSDGRFYLRGLVSSSFHKEDYNCTHSSYALYSDVLKYLDAFVLKVSL